MRAVVQRCAHASVSVDNKIVGKIKEGIIALVGFSPKDSENDIDYIIDKIANLRIFSDENGKMNLSVKDINGGILFVPNFTLYGDSRHGRRPSYIDAAGIEYANTLFETLKLKASALNIDNIEFGIFQADMKVDILNDGPITLILDSFKNF